MKENILRDFLALGSWVFFVLVLGRSLVDPFMELVIPLIATGILILAVELAWKGFDAYSSRGLVLCYFMIIYYQSAAFTIFASFVMLGLLLSSFFLEKDTKKIVYGVLIGVIGIVLGETSKIVFL